MLSSRISLLLAFSVATACSSSTPPPRVVQEKPAERRDTSPKGPTRTDFNTIAQKLVGKCIAGGWIAKWRSTAEDIDQAKPRIYLRPFEDKTNQNLDPLYLNQTLEKRMRTSGVFDMVAEGAETDFYGRGILHLLAERTGGERISVYTATLELIDPKTEKIAYSCEATVKGEM
jgi:PBP1b-binding outer membrane lipoprotein LpoB